MTTEQEVEELELDLLLDGLSRRYGLELRGHARASLRRRIETFRASEALATLSDVQSLVLRDADAAERLSQQLSVSVTSLFRDPGFYRHLREEIVPDLRTWPSVRLWIAGCATGEEVYSVGVILLEEGLADRVKIHATDRNRQALAIGRAATYNVANLKAEEAAYVESGGRGSLLDHVAIRDETAVFREELRRNVTFSVHDLAVDGRFNEFHLVMCRNVLIYFKTALKRRVLDLIHSSLAPYGVLALGAKESLRHVPGVAGFVELSTEWRTYRKEAP